jgi:hypothetical protein
MSLRGAFQTMPLPDLLQWLSEVRKSGLLTVTMEFDERTLRFENGAVVALGADDPLQRDLGRVLLARGLLDEKTLAETLDLRSRSGQPLGDVLIAGGLVARAALDGALSAHVREVVLSMFLWREGTFAFSDSASAFGRELTLPEHRIHTPLDTRELLMEGMRRVDEWQRIAALFPSEYMQVFALADDGHIPILRYLKEMGEPVALGELALARPESRYELYEQLYQAHQKGLIAIDATVHEMGPRLGRSPVDLLLESAQALLAEQQYEEAAALLRAAENLDPYRVDVRDLLRRAHEEELAALYQQLPPYKVAFVAASRNRITEVKLGPREHYLLSRIAGLWDIGTLAVMTPLGELETLKILRRLLRLSLVRLG